MMKNLFAFAWRNIWRNRRRTLITLAAVSIGVMSMVFMRSYIRGIMNSASEVMIKLNIGHVKIADSEYIRLSRIMPKEYLVEQLTDLGKDLNQLPGVRLLDGRLKFHTLASHDEVIETAVTVGITLDALERNLNMSQYISAGRTLMGSGRELVIGKTLAEQLQVEVGDELLLVTTDVNYSSYALPFEVVGIFTTGYTHLDKHMLYLPLPRAQEMLDCGDSVHELLIFLDDASTARVVAERVRPLLQEYFPERTLKAIPWQEDELMADLMPMMRKIWGNILNIVMFIVGLVILNTMLMAVMERYHEIGVIKALGFKNREVFGMIVIEAVYIGAIGAVLGALLGGPLSLWLEKNGIDMARMLGEGVMEKFDVPIPVFSSVFYPDFTFAILVGSMMFGVLVAVLAVLYPAWKSLRMSPVEAFRSELKV